MPEVVEFKELEIFRSKENLTYAELAGKIGVPENYIYRWRKKGEIKGIYAKVLREIIGKK